MKKTFFIFAILFIFIYFFQDNFANAQNSAQDTNTIQDNTKIKSATRPNEIGYDSPYACPNFEFLKDLKKGEADEDVFVLQQILNLDKRTLVVQSGPGSAGKETAFFGNATRQSLKRFQALFIEYISVADGVFNSKTRTVMNNVCKGPFFTEGTGNPLDGGNVVDKEGPIIGVAGPTLAKVGEPFRVYLGATEAIKTPSLAGLIITNATAGDVRKTSSTTFSFLVVPNQDAVGEISLQMEADSVEDLAKNKNEIASNEWIVLLTTEEIVATTTDTSILDSIIGSLPDGVTGVDCSTVTSVSVYDYTNPCYGRAPTTDPNTSSPSDSGAPKPPKQPPDIMGMLKGLMEMMKGAGAGGGGSSSAKSPCACSGGMTTFHTSLGGTIPSGFISDQQPASGDWTGQPSPPTLPCGEKMEKGKCINPQNNMAKQPVIGGNAKYKYAK